MAIVVFEHSDHTDAGRLADVLQSYGHRMRHVRLHRGDAMPADLDDVDGVITCGGPQDPTDDSLPWMAPELDYLRAANEVELPIVGICLGCQLMARAFGGEVKRMEGGIELGWHPVLLSEKGKIDAIHAGVPWTTVMPHRHRFEVTSLPPDAVHLASSARCRNQAWSLGIRAYAFQYHGEIVKGDLVRWAEDEPEAMEEAGLTAEAMREASDRHYEACERVTNRMYHHIATLVMPVDRRYPGIRQEIRH